MTLDELNMDQMTAHMTDEQRIAFNLGLEHAFRLHFRALKQVSKKVYRLPQDARHLEMEVLDKVEVLINPEPDEVVMTVSKNGGNHG